MQYGMDLDGQQNKMPKEDEEVDTKDSVTEILDNGKGSLQITQGGSEVEEPEITIEYLPSAMFSSRGVKKIFYSGEVTKKQPSLFSHYLDIKRKNTEMKKELYP
jgi:hypothetical protein